MRVIDRVVVALSALVFLALALFVLTLALGWNMANDLVFWVDYLARFGQLESLVIGTIALLLAGYLTRLAIGGLNHVPSLVREGKFGQLSISFTTLENLVQRAARNVEGIRDVQTKIRTSSQGVNISLALQVIPGVNIPQAGEMVQSQVRDYLLETAGVEANKIQVTIKNIARETKTRVE